MLKFIIGAYVVFISSCLITGTYGDESLGVAISLVFVVLAYYRYLDILDKEKERLLSLVKDSLERGEDDDVRSLLQKAKKMGIDYLNVGSYVKEGSYGPCLQRLGCEIVIADYNPNWWISGKISLSIGNSLFIKL